MITVYFFVAVFWGGMGGGISATQFGPFGSEKECLDTKEIVMKLGDKSFTKLSPCYRGVIK